MSSESLLSESALVGKWYIAECVPKLERRFKGFWVRLVRTKRVFILQDSHNTSFGCKRFLTRCYLHWPLNCIYTIPMYWNCFITEATAVEGLMGVQAFAGVSSPLQLPLKCPATLSALISVLAGHLTPPRRNAFELGSSGFTCVLAHLFVNPFLWTEMGSVILSSQSGKNVNKAQKLPVPQISEGLFGNKARLRTDPCCKPWPWPILSAALSKATARGSAPHCLRFPYLTLADTGSPRSLDFRLGWSSCGHAAPLSSAWPSSPSIGLKLIDLTPSLFALLKWSQPSEFVHCRSVELKRHQAIKFLWTTDAN